MTNYICKVGKKFITVKPIPNEFILNGLVVIFDQDTETTTEVAHTNLLIGKWKYLKPKDVRNVIQAYVRKY